MARWQFVVTDKKTGEVITPGCLVINHRGEPGTFESVTRAPEPGRSAKVQVDGRESYAEAWGLLVKIDGGLLVEAGAEEDMRPRQREALFLALFARLNGRVLPADPGEAATLMLDVLTTLQLDEKVVLFAWLGEQDTRPA